MGCTIQDRNTVRECAAECRARDEVVAVDVLSPSADLRRTWSLELVLDEEGLPPSVLDRLAEHGLTVLHVAPQGKYTHAVAALA